MRAKDASLTVIDFESTGAIRGFPDEPWQIGLVTLADGEVRTDSLFTSLLRVGDRPFNPLAPGRPDLRRAELAQAPALADLWPLLQPRLAGPPLAAHNAATERKFLRQAAPLHRFGPWLDTLRLARRAWPGRASYALEDLLAELGLMDDIRRIRPDWVAHDALSDAVGCAVLLRQLLRLPGWERATINALAG